MYPWISRELFPDPLEYAEHNLGTAAFQQQNTKT